MSITTDTRWESFEKLDRKRLYDLIVSTLIHNSENGLTAREIAVILYDKGFIINNDRQAVQPRLTELVDENVVKVIGKRFDNLTQRNVAVYALVKGDD